MKTLSMTKNAIRKRNKTFAKLSPEKKRVAVAQDVLDGLTSRKLRATQGLYVGSSRLDKLLVDNQDAQICNLLPEVNSCKVCARGAIFLSAVMLKDACKASEFVVPAEHADDAFSDIGNESRISTYLNDIFDDEQLDLIENYFEGFDGKRSLVNLSPTKRMRAIMENIVENDGYFDENKLIVKFETNTQENY